MKISLAFEKLRNGELKEGDIVQWQGCRNSDTKQTDGGYLFVVNGGKIIGRTIRGAKNKTEAIKIFNKDALHLERNIKWEDLELKEGDQWTMKLN